jgi:hypothetical protein
MCGVIGAAFWFVGFCMLLVAVQKTRSKFREKGYLRTPSGTQWFHFLMFKHYDVFDDPSIRFFFGIAHLCLMGMIIDLVAVVVLFGCELLLKYMSEGP